MARVVLVYEHKLRVFIDPSLRVGNLPEIIGKEAERLVNDDTGVQGAEAVVSGNSIDGRVPDSFHLKLHRSNRDRHEGGSYMGYSIQEDDTSVFSIHRARGNDSTDHPSEPNI